MPSNIKLDDRTRLTLSAALSMGSGMLLVLVVAIIARDALGLQHEFVALSTLSFTAMAIGLSFLLHHHLPWRNLGLANHITLGRAMMVALLAGMTANATNASVHGWLIAVVVTFNLALDGLDGWIARRQGMQSPFGARFDLEVDALLTLVLAVLVFQAGKAGIWVLLAGGLRYIFVAAGWIIPLLRAPLQPSRRRQAVCVIQTAGLGLCLTPMVTAQNAQALAAGTLGLLTLSFATDILWLIHHARAMGKGT